ncbi:MAG: phosphotransferase [Acidobacteriota bacterium]
MDELLAALATLVPAHREVEPLAGDASHRRFFRVHRSDGGTIVACLYPEGGAAQATADHDVQRWGWSRGLPIPRPLGVRGRVTVSEDLGEEDLAGAAADGLEIGGPVLDALAAFQRTHWGGLPTPPFDAAFFRRELARFERAAWPGLPASPPDVAGFLDTLAADLGRHPLRLVHRDFHANNLFLHGGRVRAVDFQDMRAGPDTYDAASLLRERGGERVIADPEAWVRMAAARLGWSPGWPDRFVACAAQRGLKVIGTFLRLAGEGKARYLTLLDEVQRHTLVALAELDAPERLRVAVARSREPERGV